MQKLLMILLAMLPLKASAAKEKAVTVADLRIERLVNPMSLDTPTPTLPKTWLYELRTKAGGEYVIN